jgi:nucleolar protein 4
MAPAHKRQKLDAQVKKVSLESKGPELDIDDSVSLSHGKAAEQTPSALEPKSEQSKDPKTLFIRQLAADVTTEDLNIHFSQSYPIKHAVAVLDAQTKTCKGYGFVTFADPEDAANALLELNGSDLKGRKLQIEHAQARNRGDEAKFGIKAEKKPKNPRDEIRPSPKIIVRNLPWSINTPEKLGQLFLSFGKIKEAILPKNKQGRMMGFGIVIVRGQKNSEKAVEMLNGKLVDGRELAVDWAADKETWEKHKLEEEEKGEDTEMLDANDDLGEDSELDEDAMRIDFDSANGDEDEDEDDLEDEEDEDDDDDEEDEYPKSDNSATLFIRNLPFTATDDSLFAHFTSFGPLRYARIVFDPTTDQSRGTGFVCFKQQSDFDTCIRGAPKSIGFNSSQAQNHTSILQDQSLDPSGAYTLEGRVLILAKAVDKSEAGRLEQESRERRQAQQNDKRRLYLLSEGRVGPKSPLFGKLAPSEQTMRDTSYKQRKTMVEKNPSLHLSLTRLAVRNIPKWITDKELKFLARKAIVEFATEMKEGRRQRLSNEELARGGEEMKEAEKKRKLSGKGIVKQAKIVFETRGGSKISGAGAKKKKEDDGEAGRSRGYGFIEYHTHRTALMGLRWLNGYKLDPKDLEVDDGPGKKGKGKPPPRVLSSEDRNRRLIVEFALENVNVVQRRNERERKSRDFGSKDNNARAGGDGDASDGPGRGFKSARGGKFQGQIRSSRSRGSNNTSQTDLGSKSNGSAPESTNNRTQQIIMRKRMGKRVARRGKSA